MDNFEVMEFNNTTQNTYGDPFSSIPMNDIDIGRESIPILELSTSFGRESLGILKLGCDNNAFNNDLSPNNLLDQAFLLSDLNSASTFQSSNFSFNFKGPDQLSPINFADFSSLQFTNSNNLLNDGFLYTTALSEKMLQQYRSRFKSLPVFNIQNSENDKQMVKQLLTRASEGCHINSSTVEEEQGNEFNDSVFIEARHLATKFNEEGSHDGFILDETDPPELINGDLENSKEEKEKYDSEKVFQKIDKLLPVDGLQKLNNKLVNHNLEQLKQQDDGLICQSSIKEIQKGPSSTEPQEQPSDLVTSSDKNEIDGKSAETVHVINNTTPAGSGRIHTEESEKILQALSLILAKNNRSEEEIEEGQCLVNTLREMLANNSAEKCKSVVNDSSKNLNGTSKVQSIITPSQNGPQLNNSTSSNFKARKSNSFSYPNKALRSKLTSGIARSPSFDGSKTKNSASSAESSAEVRNYSTENPAVNLKLKKGNSATIRRGPMKATVPMEIITKPQAKGTPTKGQQVMPKPRTRISTPIRDLQIKPMAQSTPDNKTNYSNSSMELINGRSLSSSNMQEKSNNSSPATSVSSYRDSSMSRDRSQYSQLPRRNSVSEGRKSSTTSELKRNSSMKESSLMKAMNKIRHNIAASKGPLRDCSNLSSRESFSTSGKIVTTPKRVMRAVGKENTSTVC